MHVLDPVSLGLPAGPARVAWSHSRVRSTRLASVPIAVDPTDLLMPARAGSVGVRTRGQWSRVPDGDPDQIGYLSVATVLDSWVRDWAETRGENLPRLRDGERSQVLILCSWLLDRLDWACQHHLALDEFAADVGKLASALYGNAGHGAARPKLMDAPCPECEFVTLNQPYPEAFIECSGCGRMLTYEEYEEMVKDMRQEIRAQDVLTALNYCEPVDLDKVRFAVITEADEALGEVIVLLAGRTLPGRHRLHESVTVEEFKTLDEALARRSEVLIEESA